MKYRVERIDDYRWRVPRQGGMLTDGLIFADDALMAEVRNDPAVEQVANVAHLPGIVGPSIAMPDIHWGYGFPIGGVAAFDARHGVVSPGGVGYDINCGVRLLATGLDAGRVRPKIRLLLDTLAATIPSGVGSHRTDARLDEADLRGVLTGGARWAVEAGFGRPEDLEAIEAGGCLKDAEADLVSGRAKKRGRDQLGTLGSGNHFIEVGYVADRYDDAVAERLGLDPGSVTVLIHSGSRGLGHQVCDESLDVMIAASQRYGIVLPDKQLCCAPLASPEARGYLGAMNAAANFAFANRQVMAHWVRLAFDAVCGRGTGGGTRLVYDVAHNIAKMERHTVAGHPRELCVHRKGATRALPPGHQELPGTYRDLGQPVLVPGDMGRCSYVLVGTAGAQAETFGSSCHGAGRRMSRRGAKGLARGRDVKGELAAAGIEVWAASQATIDEEMPEAYKDVSAVVDVVDKAGIGRKVAQLKPIGVLKG